jgi:hypothetical protein
MDRTDLNDIAEAAADVRQINQAISHVARRAADGTPCDPAQLLVLMAAAAMVASDRAEGIGEAAHRARPWKEGRCIQSKPSITQSPRRSGKGGPICT